MKKIQKEKTQMEKLTAGYEKFIKGKEINKNSNDKFNRVLANAVKKKK